MTQPTQAIYLARCDDGTINIGHTPDLDSLKGLASAVELLAYRPGTPADEQALHDSLVSYRNHGEEWYHPTPVVMTLVNNWRTTLRLPALP